MIKRLSQTDADRLREVARESIAYALEHEGARMVVDPASFSGALQEVRSSFVTLRLDGDLRGCMGRLEASESLVGDVARSAYNAAFEDPRFSPVSPDEFPRLEIHLSVLSPSVPLPVSSEEDLLARLRPGIDGLILKLGQKRATFLPAVWESLAEPRIFLAHLKRKARLPEDFWSGDLEFETYRAEEY